MTMIAESAGSARFGKPSMTDLPAELGKRIITQIMNTPKPDFSDTDAEVDRIRQQILDERNRRR